MIIQQMNLLTENNIINTPIHSHPHTHNNSPSTTTTTTTHETTIDKFSITTDSNINTPRGRDSNHLNNNSSLSVSISSSTSNNDNDIILNNNNNNNLIHTNSYIHDDNNQILLNTNVSRNNSLISNHSYNTNNKHKHKQNSIPQQQHTNNLKKINTHDSQFTNTNIPFHAKKHSTIVPLDETRLKRLSIQEEPQKSIPHHPSTTTTTPTPTSNKHIGLKKSDSATREIQKMRLTLLNKKEMKRKRKTFLIDDDRVLIGNKVSEGHVNFIIAYNMLTGIRVSVSHCSGIMKPLILQDFKSTKKLAFDYHGNELTPSSQYAFKFKDYSPEVFRELRALFGLDPADYLVSLTSKYILSELNSPGKSGSFFYYSRDYKYIIKTIHHSEHIHLRKHLKEYYNHVKTNPNTLLCQYYGLHRIKMPISFENKVKHRKIYFLVMNNLFPPHLDIQKTFDIKGSTWGRFTIVPKDCYNNEIDDDASENNNNNNNIIRTRPVLKDLNWLDGNERIQFGPIKKSKFLKQLKADVNLLAKLNIMDYSLLLGIHDMSKINSRFLEYGDGDNEDTTNDPNNNTNSNNNNEMEYTYDDNTMINNSIFPHYFKQYEGGIRSSNQFNQEGDIIYFIGIIDCLTNYSLLKKLETFWRSLSHDTKLVSAIPPRDYANRFYEFIEDSIDPLPKGKYTDDPNKMNDKHNTPTFNKFHD